MIKALFIGAFLVFIITACTQVYVSVEHAVIDIDTHAEVASDRNN